MPDLAPDGRAKYDWAAHAKFLTHHPGEWYLIEADVASSLITYIRKGRQPDLAPLHGRLDVRMRASYLTGTTRRGQMWAKFDPTSRIPSRRMKPPAVQRNAPLTDAEVREVRGRVKDGESLTQIADRYKISVSYVSALARGRWREKAGGPLLGTHYTTPGHPDLDQLDPAFDTDLDLDTTSPDTSEE